MLAYYDCITNYLNMYVWMNEKISHHSTDAIDEILIVKWMSVSVCECVFLHFNESYLVFNIKHVNFYRFVPNIHHTLCVAFNWIKMRHEWKKKRVSVKKHKNKAPLRSNLINMKSLSELMGIYWIRVSIKICCVNEI